jgi:hypothetical protein
VRGLKKKREEMVAGGASKEGLDRGPIHREEEGKGCAVGSVREGNPEDDR